MAEQTNADRYVWVVEDDDHIAYLLEFMMQREGLRVERFADGRAAAEGLGQGPSPELILLDIMLPYIDGFQLVQRIRQTEAWGEVPVIMLTAKAQERDIVRALDHGANDYIVKPFQPQELIARVRRYLKGRP